MSLVQHETNLVQFFESPENGTHKVNVSAAPSLAEDYYVLLPQTSGTLATQGYVTNATGGTFLGLSSDFTNTDATSTPANVTGMSFAVEANRSYFVEGALLYSDAANYGSSAAKFSVPSGSAYRFYCVSVDDNNNTSDFGTWLNTANRAPLFAGNNWLHFKGILTVGSTAGTVQLQLVNTSGDGTLQGFRTGSFIRVIDPQA
jgi:hypothetical protein